MGVVGLQPDKLVEVWPHLKWAFDSFSGRSHATRAHEFLEDVLAGRRQCWIVVEDDKVQAVALTEAKKGNGLTISLTHCAGEFREAWQEDLVSTLRDWAKAQGATRFMAVCRPGWTPFLKTMGLRETHRVMEQDLE